MGIRTALAGEGRSTFRTLVLRCACHYDAALIGRALLRHVKGPADCVALLVPDAVHPRSEPLQSSTRLDWTVWWEPPARWRDEGHDGGDVRGVNVINPDTSGAYRTSRVMRPGEKAATHPDVQQYTPPRLHERLREIPLPAPAALLPHWHISASAEVEFLGRRGVRAIAEPAHRSDWMPFHFADALHVVVDQQHGILLRCAAIVDAKEAVVVDVIDVRFDEPLSADTFAVTDGYLG